MNQSIRVHFASPPDLRRIVVACEEAIRREAVLIKPDQRRLAVMRARRKAALDRLIRLGT